MIEEARRHAGRERDFPIFSTLPQHIFIGFGLVGKSHTLLFHPRLHDRTFAVEPAPEGVSREPAEAVVALLHRVEPDSKVIFGRSGRRDGLPALDEFPNRDVGILGVRAEQWIGATALGKAGRDAGGLELPIEEVLILVQLAQAVEAGRTREAITIAWPPRWNGVSPIVMLCTILSLISPMKC